MGIFMEGFFDRADVVAEAMATVALVATQGVPVETPILFAEPVSVDEGTHTKRVSEPAPIPTETLTPQRGLLLRLLPRLRLPLLPHLLLSLLVILSRLYLRP